MKTQTPALTPAALVSTASRKTDKAQRKLREAQVEIRAANGVLKSAAPGADAEVIEAAVEQNTAAEAKVHEAAEELQVVKELLSDVVPTPGDKTPPEPAKTTGTSGDGLKSLLQHLAGRAG